MTHVTFSLAQNAFRGRNNDGTESTATWIAATNTNWSQSADVVFRVRFEALETGGATSTGTTFQIQYNRNSGGWNSITTSSTYVKAVDSQLTDGSNTVQRIGSGTFISSNAGQIEDGDGASVSFTANSRTEIEFSVQIVSADGWANNDTLQLRVVRDGGTTLNTYTQTPSITVKVPFNLTATGSAAISTTADLQNIATHNLTATGSAAITTTADLSASTTHNLTATGSAAISTTAALRAGAFITYVSQSSATVSGVPSTTSTTVDKPTDLAENDLMIAVLAMNGSAGTITVPTDWVEVAKYDTQAQRQWVYRKFATASEPANYTWSWTGSAIDYTSLSITAWRNVDQTTPIDVTPVVTYQAASTSPVYTGITTSTDDAVVMVTVAVQSTGSILPTPPGTLTEIVETAGSVHSQNYADKATAGSTGDYTFTLSTARATSGIVFALRKGGGTTYNLTATGSAAITNSAALFITRDLSATGSAAITNTAALFITRDLTATGSAAISTVADIALSRNLTATSSAAISTTADLAIARNLEATGSAAISTDAALFITRDLTATGSAAITTTAALDIARNLEATGSAAITTTADLDVTAGGTTYNLTATGSAAITTTAALFITRDLTATGSAAATVSADMRIRTLTRHLADGIAGNYMFPLWTSRVMHHVNGRTYLFLRHHALSSGNGGGMLSSADGFQTWTLHDSANAPTFTVFQADSYLDSSGVIHFSMNTRPNATTNEAHYYAFDTNTNTWTEGELASSNSSPTTSYSNTGIAVRSNGEVVIVHLGDDENVSGTNYLRVVYSIRSTGGTWTNDIAVSDTGVATHYYSPHCIVDSNDDIHIFYSLHKYRKLNSNDTLDSILSVPWANGGLTDVYVDGSTITPFAMHRDANYANRPSITYIQSGTGYKTSDSTWLTAPSRALWPDVDTSNNYIYAVSRDSSDNVLLYTLSPTRVWGSPIFLDAATFTNNSSYYHQTPLAVYTNSVGDKVAGYFYSAGAYFYYDEFVLEEATTKDLSTSGISSAAVTVTAALDIPRNLTATGSAAISTTAALAIARNLEATGSAAITVTADLSTNATHDLTATGSAAVTVDADLAIARNLTATGAAAITVTADLATTGTFDLTATGSAAISTTADLAIARNLTATGSVSLSADADLAISQNLSATGSAAITVTAGANIAFEVVATGSAAITTTANLTIIGALAALPYEVSVDVPDGYDGSEATLSEFGIDEDADDLYGAIEGAMTGYAGSQATIARYAVSEAEV